MGQTEQYLARMEGALDGSNDEDKGLLVKEVVSVFADSLPNIKQGLDRYRARIGTIGTSFTYDDTGDLKKLVGKIRQQREDRQRELDEKYGTATLSEHIAMCDTVLASGSDDEQAEFCYMMSGVYSETIPGFRNYLGFTLVGDPKPARDIPAIKEKLKAYRDSLVREANRAPSHSIYNSASAESSAAASANVSVSITSTVEAVDDLPSSALSDDEKDELVRLLHELDRNKRKGGEKLKEAAKAVADYAFDKCLQAVPTVMPYVAQAIRSAIGF
ncbi:MAG: hypothetical protein UCH28_11330 [Adlercreutzia sp.]|nr:hypothetical protein [Adlercreutzia sp.]